MRNTTPIRSYGREFAFSGLMKCADCGCAVVAEIQKGKYIYYHCTGHANGNRGNPSDCRRKYVHEEALERLLNRVLSNSIWHQGEATIRQPFDLLVKTNAEIAAENDPGGDLSTGHAVWLGDQDSNLG